MEAVDIVVHRIMVEDSQVTGNWKGTGKVPLQWSWLLPLWWALRTYFFQEHRIHMWTIVTVLLKENTYWFLLSHLSYIPSHTGSPRILSQSHEKFNWLQKPLRIYIFLGAVPLGMLKYWSSSEKEIGKWSDNYCIRSGNNRKGKNSNDYITGRGWRVGGQRALTLTAGVLWPYGAKAHPVNSTISVLRERREKDVSIWILASSLMFRGKLMPWENAEKVPPLPLPRSPPWRCWN